VEAPVLLGIGVRLVARVHDRALQRRLEPDLRLEEVRPLGHLIRDVAAAFGSAEQPGAGEDLSRHEERHDVPRDPNERHRAVDEIVLVRAVGGALAVGVVLVDDHPAGARHHRRRPLDRGLEDPLPRLVVDHELPWVRALRRRELGVRVVDVVPRAVGEDHVRESEIFVGRRRGLAHRLEAARVAKRRLLLVVPADAAQGLRGVRVDQ
jgi:hypothetical protein